MTGLSRNRSLSVYGTWQGIVVQQCGAAIRGWNSNIVLAGGVTKLLLICVAYDLVAEKMKDVSVIDFSIQPHPNPIFHFYLST